MPLRVLMIRRQTSGVGYYRTTLPSRALIAAGFDVTISPGSYYYLKPSPSEWLKQRVGTFDVLFTDRGCQLDEIGGNDRTGEPGYFWTVAATPNARMLVDFDDHFLDIPKWNVARTRWMPGQEYTNAGLMHLASSQLTTVSTPPLVDLYREHSHAIRCIPNHIDPADWDHPVNPARSADPRIRIYYGGADGHFGDLDPIRDGLERFLRNPPLPVRFIAFGAMPAWLHRLREDLPQTVVNLPWVPIGNYAASVAWGGFDLAIAPLTPHPFNDCRSNIKALEAGLLGQAFIASKTGPYKDIPDDAAYLTPHTSKGWEAALTRAVTEASERKAKAARLREWVLDGWTVAHSVGLWKEAVETTYSLPVKQALADFITPHQRRQYGVVTP